MPVQSQSQCLGARVTSRCVLYCSVMLRAFIYRASTARRFLARLSSSAVKTPDPHDGPIVTPNTFRGMQAHFPCLARPDEWPEPRYTDRARGYETFSSKTPFTFRWGGILPEISISYETWGKLNDSKSNAILLHPSLSTSSHAKSNKGNPDAGWWEDFIGPGRPLNTDEFFIICTNNLGSCYGSSGPSSLNPETEKPYGMTFPLLTVEDIVRSQFLLLDHLGIEKIHAAIGSSLGGMESLQAAALFPDRVERAISVSACVRTHPQSIALRYCQRRIIMSDPNWNGGNYYEGKFPFVGMRHARELGTYTYRSGPEWEERFGHERHSPTEPPNFCPDFEIEHYLEHAGNKFSLIYDPNSVLYISKAMDLFDLGDGCDSLLSGVARITCPVLVLGVPSDVLFPVSQQREAADILRNTGNSAVTYYEINSIYGHDTFFFDFHNVGTAIKGYLESSLAIIS
ncbi:uncharacterized protein [Oscarella lobularis]|uniref:uncharacterized protein n=1 Tax=Oscarella lobularis TaxID=121494 RepID=UPI0033143AF4